MRIKDVAREILAPEKGLPIAVLAANDLMALGVMQEFRESGVAISQDVSIIGFDDIAFATLSTPPLATVCLPRVELSRRAVEALITTIESPDEPGVEIRIPTHQKRWFLFNDVMIGATAEEAEIALAQFLARTSI